VTPQGIIQGRDAIQKDADKRFQSRFQDLALTPLIRLRELNLGGRGMDHEDRRPACPRLLCNDVGP
jgi:hypothetical protein